MSVFDLFVYFATVFFFVSGLLVTWIASEYGLRQRVLGFLIAAGALWFVAVSIFMSML